MHLIIEQLINGLMLSCTYVLIGVGFSLFFGALNVIHFAHGDVCMVGAFMALGAYTLFVKLGLAQTLPGWQVSAAVLMLGVFATSFLGILVERISIRPFRQMPILIPLVATVAIGIILRDSLKNFYPGGGVPQSFPALFPEGIALAWGRTKISYDNLIILLGSVVLIGALFLFINRTRLGTAIRAVSEDGNIALMMGINLNRTVGLTFFIGSALGAVAGIINGLYFGGIRYDFGLMFGTKGFAVSVVGGLGNVYGAVIGGLLFGMIETFSMGFVPGGTAWKEFITFSVVILFLIFRPRGILGEKVFEKV
jgi:branched-chain amino acid transport system permease protein